MIVSLALWWTGDLCRMFSASQPVTAGIGSRTLPPCSGWMDELDRLSHWIFKMALRVLHRLSYNCKIRIPTEETLGHLLPFGLIFRALVFLTFWKAQDMHLICSLSTSYTTKACTVGHTCPLHILCLAPWDKKPNISVWLVLLFGIWRTWQRAKTPVYLSDAVLSHCARCYKQLLQPAYTEQHLHSFEFLQSFVFL